MTGTVLYIDDVPDNIVVVQRLLKRARPDITLYTAGTGRDGIEVASDVKPALILLDNRLPDMRGKQVLSQLAASAATAAIPVIILSGDSGRVTVKEFVEAGAAEFLAKPFDVHRLLEIIGRYLP